MSDIEIQKRFIQLRSQGLSFGRIADELHIARRTLINWSRKFQYEIQNLRAIELEGLQEQLIATREVRARALSEHLRRVETELKKRDVAELSTSRLFGLADSLRHEIIRETGQLQFTTPVTDIPDEEHHEKVQDWKP